MDAKRYSLIVGVLFVVGVNPIMAKSYPKSGIEYDAHAGHSKIEACKVAYRGAENKVSQKIASNMSYEVEDRECDCEKSDEKVLGRDWYECEAEIKWSASAD